MILNLSYDSSVNSAPAAFKSAVVAVAQFFQSQFTSPITINIDVGYGEIAGQALSSGALGESETFLDNFTYSQVKSGLVASAKSADAITAAGTLPNTDPTNGGNFWVPTAEGKAIGLTAASSNLDGYVGFSSTSPFTFDNSHGVAGGTYDFYGVVAHEFSEVMGRMLLVGGSIGSTPNSYVPLDLFHYSGPGVHTFSGTNPGYFSINGGTTNLDNFNTNTNGDFGDWAGTAGNDAFLAFSNSGVVNAITETDLKLLNILGYDRPPVTVVHNPAASSDFNGDGMSDILWRKDSGAVNIWSMNGAQSTGQNLTVQPDNTWHVQATDGDFNGDGRSDILWRNDNGTVTIWEMNGSQIQAGLNVSAAPDSSWHINGVGDFNGDGKSDILWRNDNGALTEWQMNGAQITSAQNLAAQPDKTWHVVGIADFNGDGKSDIFWRNDNGTINIWTMNGAQITGQNVSVQPDKTWHVVGTGDFSGDGSSDVLWRNDNGTLTIWQMNGAQVLSAQNIGSVPDSTWHVAQTGDFNGDGKTDILWRNDNGALVEWQMNGAQIASAQTVPGSPDNTWHVQNHHFDMV